MILLSRLGGPDFALNPDLIERAEATPDTVITLVSGNKYVIRQSIDELIALICHDRASVLATAEQLGESHRNSAADPARHDNAVRSSRQAARVRDLSGVHSVVPLHPQEG